MKIDDVRVVGEPLVLATQADIDGLESRLWFTFPEGYRDYLTRLGEGVLGSFVRIYPPWRVENELAAWRRRIAKYWFWDEGRDVLPKERAMECVIVGDTVNGDEIVFHPSRRDHLFVLPRDDEQIFDSGADLLATVEWVAAQANWSSRARTRLRAVRQPSAGAGQRGRAGLGEGWTIPRVSRWMIW